VSNDASLHQAQIILTAYVGAGLRIYFLPPPREESESGLLYRSRTVSLCAV
jgi:hypothetical protein